MKDTSRVTLEVQNPRSARKDSAARPPTPRPGGLDGRKIGLYWNGKPDGDYFWDMIAGLLAGRFPGVDVRREYLRRKRTTVPLAPVPCRPGL